MDGKKPCFHLFLVVLLSVSTSEIYVSVRNNETSNVIESDQFCASIKNYSMTFCSESIPDETLVLSDDRIFLCASVCLEFRGCVGFNWWKNESTLCSIYMNPSKIVLVSNRDFCRYYSTCGIDTVNLDILVTFEITVKTGTLSGAGTDADVIFTLNFPHGVSHPFKVIGADNLPLFENSCLDVLTFNFKSRSTSSLKLQYLKLEHNNTGVRPDWFISYVKLVNLNTGESWYFTCNLWLKDPYLSVILYQ